MKKSVNEEKAARKGAEAQRFARQIKQLFFAFLCALASLREAVNFYPDSEADGLVTVRITDLGHVANTTACGVEGEPL